MLGHVKRASNQLSGRDQARRPDIGDYNVGRLLLKRMEIYDSWVLDFHVREFHYWSGVPENIDQTRH